MSGMLETPRDLVQSVAEMRLPEKSNLRLQELMDRNSQGQLIPQERDELESLAELSETMSLLRARALFALGQRPQ